MAVAHTLESVSKSPDLPTLPAVALRVLEMTRSANFRLSEMAGVIQNDQALVTKILRTVNSSYYGLSKPCPTITRAVGFLGLDAVKTLVLSFSLVESLDGGKGEDDIAFDFLSYWRRAVQSASAARRIASVAGVADAEEAFLAALMQDIGMVALYRVTSETYLQIVDMAGDDHRRLPAIELRSFEFTHAQVGACIAEKWRLAPSQVAAIRHHHDSSQTPPTHQPFVRVVEAATLVAEVLSRPDGGVAIEIFRRAMTDWFGVDEQASNALLQQSSADAGALSRLLEIDTGRQPDIKAILHQAALLRASLPDSVLPDHLAA